MSWTQPICNECWADKNPGRAPVRLLEPDEETCAFCGKTTASGIYTREDPTKVPFPYERDED